MKRLMLSIAAALLVSALAVEPALADGPSTVPQATMLADGLFEVIWPDQRQSGRAATWRSRVARCGGIALFHFRRA